MSEEKPLNIRETLVMNEQAGYLGSKIFISFLIQLILYEQLGDSKKLTNLENVIKSK